MRVFNNLILIGLLAALAGCSRAGDKAYLTPIPEATIKAYFELTPEPLARGCAFVLLDPDGGHELGTFSCPE
jgi:hypothetical protein